MRFPENSRVGYLSKPLSIIGAPADEGTARGDVRRFPIKRSPDELSAKQGVTSDTSHAATLRTGSWSSWNNIDGAAVAGPFGELSWFVLG